MKKMIAIVTLLALSTSVFARDNARTCEEKKQNIQDRISYAQKNNDAYRVAKLNSKLDYVNKYCSNEQLAAKRQQKVQGREYRVKIAELEVQEAIAETRTPASIQKKKLILERAKQRLVDAKARV